MSSKGFGVVDFVVFFGMLGIAVLIGIYYACKDRKKKSMDEYYFGGKNMSPIPVGISMAVTLISSITVLGFPAHAYLYGTIVAWFGVCMIIQVIIACLYYIPLFQRLKIKSVYEYLEIRFHKWLRKFMSLFIIFNNVFFMGTIVYVTALALNAVTPMSLNVSIILSAGICTIYTSLGGMKAVIWTDTIQAFVMAAGALAVLIKTTILVGGVAEVSAAVVRGGRDTIWDFDPDPTLRHTFWTLFVGLGLTWCSAACTNQAITQRYQSCKNVKDARIAAITSGVPVVLLPIIAALSGCAMYAYYEGCDPVTKGAIRKVDQIVPYLVVEIFTDTPGMAGLFVSAAYSEMLSTVSSGINAMSALVIEDFVVVFKPEMKEVTRLSLSKVLTLFFGVFTTGMAFFTQFMGKTVIQIASTLLGLFSGPMLGVYTAGIFFPWTNTIGAAIGSISGILFAVWVAVGQTMYGGKQENLRALPLSADNCPIPVTTTGSNLSDFSMIAGTIEWNRTGSGWNATPAWEATLGMNTTLYLNNITTVATQDERPALADTLYALSVFYLGPLGFVMTLAVALLVSFLTGATDPKTLNPSLFMPFVDNKHLPESVRTFFRFGVPEIPEKEIKASMFQNVKLRPETNLTYKETFKDMNKRNGQTTEDEIILLDTVI